MLDLVHMIDQVLVLLESSKYILLFLGSYFEGSVAMMAGGLLYRLGQVDFWPMYAAIFMGDFLSDIMWYFIGYFGARKFLTKYGKFINIPFVYGLALIEVEILFFFFKEKIETESRNMDC